MTHTPRRRLLAASTLLVAPAIVRAQPAWPVRPVRVVNPYAPGGTSDVVMRLMAERLERALGQPFVIESRPGAGGSIGTAAAAAAAPDGYTLLISNTGPLSVAQTLFPSLPYDVSRSFSWIAMFGGAPMVCAVKGDSPLRTLADYVAAARAQPEAVSYGNSGVGSVGHLTGVMFGMAVGAQLLLVPFRGASEAQTAVLSGNVTSVWDTIGAYAGAIRSGSMRALGFTSPERAVFMPEVPTVKEQGWPDVVSTNWFLMAGPAGMPPSIAARVNEVCQAALAEPVVRERIASIGMVGLGNLSPVQIQGFVNAETERWAPIVRASGARPG
jgi:tripartite-type tricarboxylate transporter receptor subunit TctC